MFASLTHLGKALMLESEKRMDDKSYNAAQHVQSWLPTVCFVNNFKTQVKFFVYLAVVGFFLSAAFAKPTNPCNVETQFWVENEDGSSSCVDCETCPPGQSLSHECGKQLPYTAMVNCVSCKSGVSFSDKYDSSSCTPCSSCADDQLVLRNCTPEWDIKCGKGCYSMDRYYDEDKGDCLPCSKCCHDDQDVVETECKKKLGAGSDKICSLHSSVNRCDQSTPSPQKPTAITTIQNTSMSSGASPSQRFKHEHPVPPTALAHHHLSTARGLVFLISFSIPVVLALLMIFGCYVCKARQECIYSWCSSNSETDIPRPGKNAPNKSTVVRYNTNGNLEMIVVGGDLVGTHTRDVTSTDSLKPLLGEDNQEEPACSHPQDSKLLNSLLNHEEDLKEISVRLDTTIKGVGDYRVVAQHYGFSHYEISSVLEKHARGPSTALIEWLAASKPGLTVYEFAAVVGEKAKRKDVVEVLLAYDSTKK